VPPLIPYSYATKEQFIVHRPSVIGHRSSFRPFDSSRRIRYRPCLPIAISRPLGYPILRLAAAAASNAQLSPMLPTSTFTACKTRPFKHIQQGLQKPTGPMTGRGSLSMIPVTAMPILRLLTFRYTIPLWCCCSALGNAAKLGWICYQAKKSNRTVRLPLSPLQSLLYYNRARYG